MARRRRKQRSRGKSNNRSSKSRGSNLDPKRRSNNIIPAEVENGVVLFDNDEFYGVYLDLLMYDFRKEPLVRVETLGDFEMFKRQITNGNYEGNVYIVDELFGWGEVDINKLVENLRKLDNKAHIIGATALTEEDIANAQLYDTIVLKSKGGHDQSLTKQLANILQVELEEAKDPEYKEARG